MAFSVFAFSITVYELRSILNEKRWNKNTEANGNKSNYNSINRQRQTEKSTSKQTIFYCDCCSFKTKRWNTQTHTHKKSNTKWNNLNQKPQTIIVIDNNNGTSIKQCKWVRKVCARSPQPLFKCYRMRMRIQWHKFSALALWHRKFICM